MSLHASNDVLTSLVERDLKEATKLDRKESKAMMEQMAVLSPTEARFLVDSYYIAQGDRIRYDNQVRTMVESGEPNLVLNYLSLQARKQEDIIKKALDAYTIEHPVGAWLRTIRGMGPVTSAGLLAYIDISKAPTAGAIWKYAGIDGQSVWEKGQKRPWNPEFKTLCCVPGTIVTTSEGARNIEDIQVGELVLTHTGNWKPVTAVKKNPFNGFVNQLTAYGMGGKNGPIVTDGHPILSKTLRVHKYTSEKRERFKLNPRSTVKKGTLTDAQWSELEIRVAQNETSTYIAEQLGCSVSLVSSYRTGARKRPVKVDPVDWIAAEKLGVGNLILSPTPPSFDRDVYINFEDFKRLHNPSKGLSFKINHDIARVIGLFIGDGHTNRTNVHWSFGANELEFVMCVVNTLKKEFGIETNYALNSEGNMYQVVCGSKQLQTWFDSYVGKYSDKVTIPSFFFGAEKSVIKGLLRGLFDSDGHYSVETKQSSFSTVNKKLAENVQQLLRMFGIQTNIVRGSHFNNFNDRERHKTKLCIHYTVSVNNVSKLFEEILDKEPFETAYSSVREWDDVGSWHAVTGNDRFAYEGLVYNLEVEGDHSYVANGVAVHNCYKIGESFVKTSNKEDSVYGKMYKERKVLEHERNNAGGNSEAAARELTAKNYTKGTITRKALEAGKWSDAHLHARARRYAVKMFLSHLHEVMYITILGQKPPMPFAIAHLNHAHYVKVPNPQHIREFVEPVEVEEVETTLI